MTTADEVASDLRLCNGSPQVLAIINAQCPRVGTLCGVLLFGRLENAWLTLDKTRERLRKVLETYYPNFDIKNAAIKDEGTNQLFALDPSQQDDAPVS